MMSCQIIDTQGNLFKGPFRKLGEGSYSTVRLVICL